MSDLVVDGADRRVAALNAFTAAVGAGIAATMSDPRLLGPQHWWWPAGLGLALGGLAAVIPLRRKARAAAAVLACCWAAPCEWVAYGWGTGRLWSGSYWEALAGGAAVLGAAAAVWATPTDYGAPMHQPAPTAVPAPAVPDEWAVMIERVTKGKIKGVHGVTVRQWDTGTGYTVHAVMPPDGSTWETLQPYEPGLAAALRLPPGGGVEVHPDLEADAAAFTVRVLERDAMAGSMTYPGLEDDDGGY